MTVDLSARTARVDLVEPAECPSRPCPIPTADRGRLATVVPLSPAAVDGTSLDDAATTAERLALAAELLAERYAAAASPRLQVRDRSEQLVVWTLEAAARQARQVADQHATRCQVTRSAQQRARTRLARTSPAGGAA